MAEDSIMEIRKIKHPIWQNEEKTRIKCQFHYEDGSHAEASVMDTEEGNPDWAELMETFGVEGVDASHAIYLEERAKSAELHEADKIDEVKSSKDRTLKSRIRKASSLMEISTFTALLVMKEIDANEKAKKVK